MRPLPRRASVLLVLPVLALTALTAPSSAAVGKTTFTRWDTTRELATGTTSNAEVTNDAVYLARGTTATWTSPWHDLGYDAKTLVPSWRVSTRPGSYAVVKVRVRHGSTVGSWDNVARWAFNSDTLRRASSTSQTDDLAKLSVDTIVANSGKAFDGFQVKVELHRTSTKVKAPILGAVNVTAANFSTRNPSTSETTMTRTVDLDVPRSSQMVHRKHHTKYDGGGAAWCSPTSANMVMRYAGKGPSASTYAWTKEKEGYVDHAARYSYDWRYEGTGNWAFTAAYAGEYGADAFVTRLMSLRDAEAFIKAGIPLVASIAFGKGQLSGAPLTSTPGHMVVIRGFTSTGAVIVNDPAASSNSTVRRTYSRAQFEKAWQNGGGGIVYVIRSRSTDLPADTARW